MWDFSVALSVKLVLRTLPFLLLRAAISLLSVAVLGIAFIGGMYALGWISRLSLVPEIRKWSVIAGLAGLGIGFLILRWARAWVLYLVKAAHIAVLTELVQGRPLPEGRGQIRYGQAVVRERFGEASALFLLDGLIRTALRMIDRLTLGFLSVLPEKLAAQIGFAIRSFLYSAISFVDEIVLAHAINTRSEDPWALARNALALYGQNWGVIVKNALWLTLIAVGLGALVGYLVLLPLWSDYQAAPSPATYTPLLIAAVVTAVLALAFFGPFALICMMQVWFRIISGGTASPSWSAKVSQIAPELGQHRGPSLPVRSFGSTTRNGDPV